MEVLNVEALQVVYNCGLIILIGYMSLYVFVWIVRSLRGFTY